MDSENVLDSTAALLNTPPKKSKIGNSLIWLQSIVFLAGLGLLFYLIYKIGFQTLLETIRRVGWGIFIIIFLNGARHFLRALCIYLAIPPSQRSVKFSSVVAARLGGEAVSVVTFTGPFLGDATKAALLRKNISLSKSGVVIVADNFLYYVSVIILILSGVGLMTYSFAVSPAVRYILFGVAFSVFAGFVGMALLLRFRVKPFSFLIKKLSERNLAPSFALKKKDKILELENNVYQLYASRRTTLFAVFGLIFVAHVLSVCEVYTAMRLLDFPPSIPVAFITESLTKVVNLAFSFVPGGVGIYEGGNGVILKSLGYTTAAGVALALVRRGAILAWTGVGLAILLWRGVSRGSRKFLRSGK